MENLLNKTLSEPTKEAEKETGTEENEEPRENPEDIEDRIEKDKIRKKEEMLDSFYKNEITKLRKEEFSEEDSRWKKIKEIGQKKSDHKNNNEEIKQKETKQEAHSFGDKFHKKYLSVRAWFGGVKDLDQFQDLVGYFESELKDYDTEIIKTDKLTEEQKEELKKEKESGGWIYEESSYDKENKKITFKKAKPFTVDTDNLRLLKNLISPNNNSLELVVGLKDVGFDFVEEFNDDDKKHIKKIGRFIKAPNAKEAIGLLKKIPRLNDLWFYYDDETKGKLDFLIELAESKNPESVLSKEMAEKINIVSTALDTSYDIEKIEKLKEIASNPDYLDYIINNPSFSIYSLPNLKEQEKEGVLKPTLELYRSGIYIDYENSKNFDGLYGSDPEKRKTSLAHFKNVFLERGEIKELLKNEDKQNLYKSISEYVGENLPLGDVLQLENIFNGSQINTKEALYISKLILGNKELGSRTSGIKLIGNIAGDPKLKEVIVSNEFYEFTKFFKENVDYSPSPHEFNANSELIKIFEEPELIRESMSDTVVNTIKATRNAFQLNNIDYYVELARYPESVNLINSVKETLGKDTISTHDLPYLITISRDSELSKEIISHNKLFFELFKPRSQKTTSLRDIVFGSGKFKELQNNPKMAEDFFRIANEKEIPLEPLGDFEKIRLIAEQNLFDIVVRFKGSPQTMEFVLNNLEIISNASKRNLIDIILQFKESPQTIDLILKNSENFTDASNKKPAELFNEILTKTETKTVRNKIMKRGELIGVLLGEQRYDTLAETAGLDPEESPEIKRLKSFVESNNVGDKGRTIATLLAMREYREGEDLSILLKKIDKKISSYEELLKKYDFHNIPEGLRASIGMEYEITKSTSDAYGNQNDGNDLRKDMSDISHFANVGNGADAVFEIATKPSDNPYMMLLEMQLLQDLGYVDFNFKNPDYEKGARGYHMTIGGERGINISSNSNFLQNALMMSGWGGINAGKNIDMLSKGRGVNIRQRNSSGTQAIFENAKPAVEFRSLSLDTWEPFERVVETSYFGAIAVQAFEKHVVESPRIFELELSDPEQFYELLKQNDLIVEATEDKSVKKIIFEWVKLQKGMMEDLSDHNENFLQNEMYGYSDDNDNFIEAEEFGGSSNKERFEGVAGDEMGLEKYAQDIQIQPDSLFAPATPELANKCSKITNLFLKITDESGGDVVNANSSLDTTKVGMRTEESDPRAKYQSLFETGGKTRDGYYYTQGGSEKMIIHKVQKRLLEFKKIIQEIIS